MSSDRTIVLKGDPLRQEAKAAGTITPGHLIQFNSSGNVVVHATAKGNAAAMFAIENALYGKEVGTDYSSGL